MHNEIYQALEVMIFYNNRGAGLTIATENQILPTKRLSLSSKEIKAIIACMKTLISTATTPNK